MKPPIKRDNATWSSVNAKVDAEEVVITSIVCVIVVALPLMGLIIHYACSK